MKYDISKVYSVHQNIEKIEERTRDIFPEKMIPIIDLSMKILSDNNV